jgi:hypothetical protein
MPGSYNPPKPRAHPIDYLIKKAEAGWKKTLATETKELSTAAKAYRKRRGRHPPAGFDKWFEYAVGNGGIVVEDFFDQIYHDLTPFWGMDPQRIRLLAHHYEHVISVRNGSASVKTDMGVREWVENWTNMVTVLEQWLPDVDVPLNVMDESRVIVPWEDIDRAVRAERNASRILPEKDVVTETSSLSGLDANPGEFVGVEWHGPKESMWDIARVGCAPDSPSRDKEPATDLSGPPPMPAGFPKHSWQGYVQNWTTAKDPCLNPDIRESHGTFIEPLSTSTTHDMFPIFGGSKLPMNNDILIPPAMYWSQNPMFHADDHGPDWDKKELKLIWRGGASGGRNKRENWTRFQRHRFISMVNGTAVQVAERNPESAGHGPNFVLQSYEKYHLTSTQHMDLGSWLNKFSDAGFVHLSCFPSTDGPTCPYTDQYYEIKNNMKLEEQYKSKFLPDIDGNSFSGRYLSFLRSTSLPIKATIYSEWHDSRLAPWVHFVPMDNSFVDIYGILDYFVGTGREYKVAKTGKVLMEGSHDAAAEKIALAGKAWAEKVLRQEDMLIYMMRLLMEWARVCDDQRENMGFVGDVNK